jgi:hypothetical protein
VNFDQACNLASSLVFMLLIVTVLGLPLIDCEHDDEQEHEITNASFTWPVP